MVQSIGQSTGTILPVAMHGGRRQQQQQEQQEHETVQYKGGAYKVHRGKKGGLFFYVKKDGVRVKKYITQPIP